VSPSGTGRCASSRTSASPRTTPVNYPFLSSRTDSISFRGGCTSDGRVTTARLEARGAARERTYRVAYNRTVAERVACEDCPRGEDRAFGPCEAAGGLVLQERAGETTVVAVAVDLRVRSPRASTDATIVVRPRA
jgi:folate-binding Fe-S cluster repair protein YgfZ